MHNIKFAFRTLFKTPFVTTVAVLSLALGIGANTAIFSLFNQMLLQPLPVSDPMTLVNLSAPGPKPGSTSCNQAGDCDDVFSYPMFRDLEKDSEGLSGLAGHRLFGANMAFDGQTINGEGVLVTGGYFQTLGLTPVVGRLLTPGDDTTPGESPVVVLSHLFWTMRFGSDRNVVNRTILINGVTHTIVGVAPEGFFGTTYGPRPQVFVPVTMRARFDPNFNGFQNRRNYWLYVFGRLAPGFTLEAANSRVEGKYRSLINGVEVPLQQDMSAATLERFKAKPLVMTPGQHGQSDIRREASTPLSILLAVTAVVLLIACANIANLLLARSAARANEMAVRLSVGASRWNLVGQLLLESCLLALMGGALGLLVAQWTLKAIAYMLPAEAVATIALEIDPLVLAFAAALSLVTGVLFGLFPAMHSTRPDLASTLKGTAGQSAGGNRTAAFFRSGLVVLQMALSMALLASAGLFIKSLYQVSRVDLGVNVDQVTTFRVSPRLNGYAPERSKQIFERLEQALAAEPGVESVTASMVPLLAGSNWGTDVAVQGFASGPDIDSNSRLNAVGPAYFATLGVPILAGREFTESDRLGSRKVAVVNQAFAEKFKLGTDVVGKLMGQNGSGGEMDMEIVGLVENAKYSEVKGTIPPLFFTPYRQDERIGDISFYVRSAVAPEQIVRRIPAIVASIDRDLPVEELRTMPQQVRENVFLDRLISTLASAFAALATLLAAIGLYGVLAYTVSQRTKEFGLRMALGADGANVRRLVLRQVGIMALLGGVIGLALAWGIGAQAESLLFEMTGSDPWVFAAAFLGLGLVALAAGVLPAHRASKVDPMRALRWE